MVKNVRVAMKKNMEKLEEMYQKELELVEKHKKNAEELKKKEMDLAEKHKINAADIKKEIELLQGNVIHEKAKALQLTETEYSRFIRLLGADKKTVMDAINLVLQEQETKKGEGKDEESPNVGGESGRTSGEEPRVSGEQQRTKDMD